MATLDPQIKASIEVINASCRRKKHPHWNSFIELPRFMTTFKSFAGDRPVSDDGSSALFDAPQMIAVPDGAVAMRHRIELNDTHTGQEQIAAVAKAANDMHLRVLRTLASGPKFKKAKIYVKQGNRLEEHTLGELAARADFDQLQVTVTPYVDPLSGKFFHEDGDNKIEFHLFSSSPTLLCEMGARLFEYEGVRMLNTLGMSF